MTQPHFETTVPDDGHLVLPPEFRGMRISVRKTPVFSENDLDAQSSINSMTLDRLAETHETGIFSLIGILKNADRDDESPNERYDALMERYYRARDID